MCFFFVVVKPYEINIKNKKKKGKSHLASVRIVGNKGYPKRNAFANYNKNDKVQNDVNLLSFYLKNRKAADEYKQPAYVLQSGRFNFY